MSNGRLCQICGKPVESNISIRMVCNYHGSAKYAFESIKTMFYDPIALQGLLLAGFLLSFSYLLPSIYQVVYNLSVAAFVIWFTLKRLDNHRKGLKKVHN